MVSMLGPEYIAKLNAAAAQLGTVLDIFVLDARGAMRLVPREDLAGAEFLDGGNVARAASGTLYPLAVRCAQAIDAIAALARETSEG